MRSKSGDYIWFESSIRLLDDSQSENRKIIVVSRNINERKLTEQKLKEANEILRNLSTIDGLTSVKNRRSFDERLGMEWKRAIRNGTTLSLIMIDLDHFKNYNDTYGHQAGDICLREVAQAVENSLCQSGDYAVFRYGGEEFSVILPEIGEDGALLIANQLCVMIEELNIPHQGSKVSHMSLLV